MERTQLSNGTFGIPSQRKYELDTKEHTLSAIKLFNLVDSEHERELADNILLAIQRFSISCDEIHVTEKNRFYKYYTDGLHVDSTVTNHRKTMSVGELKDMMELCTHDIGEIKTLGETVLGFLDDGTFTVNQVINAITGILFSGESVLTLCIDAVIATIYVLGAVVPFLTIQSLLRTQIEQLNQLPYHQRTTPCMKMYTQAIDKFISVETKKDAEMLSESIFIGDSLSNLIVVLEAPNDDAIDYTSDIDGGEGDSTNDYTGSGNSRVYDEGGETDENGNTSGTNNESDQIDYTDNDSDISSDGDDSGDLLSDEGEEDQNKDNSSPDSNDDTDDNNDNFDDNTSTGDDLGEPTDYTDGDSDDVSTQDDVDNSSSDEDTNQDKNIIVKNYNLLLDFKSMYQAIDEILSNLEPVIFNRSIQNSVIDQVIKNMTRLKNSVMGYIEFHFNTDYVVNLYYYSIFIQAMKINLEILHKNNQLDRDN